MNWLLIAALSAALYLGAFAVCLSRRRWTRTALAVGIINLFVTVLVSVAPVRGLLDPDYLGFSFGMIRVEPGLAVTLVAGSIYVFATLAACAAVLNLRGKPMRFVAAFDLLVGVNFAGDLLSDLFRRPEMLKIQLGEFLQIGPVGAALIQSVIIVLPMWLGAFWAWRRSTN